MGTCLSQEPDVDFDSPVDFNHFHILRAIGKGAFGKVCIVKKKDTKQMYAMKYMNKIQIIRKHAVDNVFREIKILCSVEHSFLVNLWFTFQDREDMCMVLDLMLGGDISYHLEKQGKFTIQRVKLYIAEVSLALEYLRSKDIIHRDIKPANMLLDSQGHVHVTDFNVATIVRPNIPIMSTTGTKPYMAPEVVQPSSNGYLYAVDWWSLGVSAYEMLRGHRPFIMEKNMTTSAIYNLLMHTRPSASVNWDNYTCDVLKMLLHPDDSKRLQTADSMRKHPFFKELSWEEVAEKTVTPSFVPPQNRINCDPTHELEEMIVEPNPLHKKRHRLSKRKVRTEEDAIEKELDKISKQFKEYDRQKKKQKEEEAKKPASEPEVEDSSIKRLIPESSPSHQPADSDLVDESEGHLEEGGATGGMKELVVAAEVMANAEGTGASEVGNREQKQSPVRAVGENKAGDAREGEKESPSLDGLLEGGNSEEGKSEMEEGGVVVSKNSALSANTAQDLSEEQDRTPRDLPKD